MMINLEMEMKELCRSPYNTHSKRSLIRTSHACHRRRAAGRNQQVEGYKHTHTHTHTKSVNDKITPLLNKIKLFISSFHQQSHKQLL